ncbi:MAG: sugar transferase [Bacteroidales bacterium]|nr:sugar transferase [Bacteroidales bacterium]
MKKERLLLFIIDLLIISASFLVFVWFKPASVRMYLPNYLLPFLVYSGLWLFISFFSKKYEITEESTIYTTNRNILLPNFITLSTITFFFYMLRYYHFSRLIVFGTIILATILELILFNLVFYLKHSQVSEEMEQEVLDNQLKLDFWAPSKVVFQKVRKKIPERIREFILNECNVDALELISRYIDIVNPTSLTLSTTTQFNVDKQPDNYFNNLVNLKRINDIRYLNKFFEAVNHKIFAGGIFIGCAETKNMRKHRILAKYPPVINYVLYFFDYILKRVFPKFTLTKKIYFFLTRGQNRVLTRAEILGRLYSCGFEIIDEQEIQGSFFFVARKVKEPAFDLNPTYGPFIRLKRVGKNGKIIKVYKFRTMHPYAEYLQEYIYKKYNLEEGGKFRNDFRVSTVGKIMRKLWIDEIPMILNMLKGEMKIVGVRPLSQHYFNLYTPELQQKRIKYKPGLIPPFYADMPGTLEEIMESELKYLNSYEKHPRLTDLKYFFRAFKNIVFRKARSN